MSKIYIVSAKKTGKSRLVRANTMIQAVRHVADEVFAVRSATHDEIFKLMQDGAPVSDAAKPVQTDIADQPETAVAEENNHG